MPETTTSESAYRRIWGAEPAVAEPTPPERSLWPDKSDADLQKMLKQVGDELNARGNKRYEATGNAREVLR